MFIQTEAYYFSKELLSDFYKQRFPLSQHPNFLVINYPTKAYIGNQIAKTALVCESLDDDVMTLRGKLRVSRMDGPPVRLHLHGNSRPDFD